VLTAALKSARHLRSDRVLCLPGSVPITRDRVIKAVRSEDAIRLLDGRSGDLQSPEMFGET
jgi:hypothetical protein